MLVPQDKHVCLVKPALSIEEELAGGGSVAVAFAIGDMCFVTHDL